MSDADVADLLARSWAAHDRAKNLRRQSALGGMDPQARAELATARALRLDADALDPTHTAAAWAEEQRRTPTHQDTHLVTLAFYAQQLGV